MPAKPALERMSRVDNAWLRMDSEANLMVIVGVWMVRPPITLAQLKERVTERLLKYDRFRQKVVDDALGTAWLDDEDFDIDDHVVAEKLPIVAGQRAEDALKVRVGELATLPLDSARPLWQIHLIPDIGGEMAGTSAVVFRIHHCIADGIALMSVTLSLTDGGKPPPERRPRREPAEAEGQPGHETGHEDDWLADAVLKPLSDITVKAIGMYGSGVAKSMDMLSHPAQPLAGGVEVARMGVQVVSDVAALLLMNDDTHTRLKGQATPGKRVAWGDPLDLDLVKAVGKALGCSINDVLLACVAGAIGSYLEDQGDPVEGAEIRAMVPVNLRPLEEAWKLGNRFGLAPLVLPLGIGNPVERVFSVRQRMSDLKGSYQPLLAFAVLAVAGLLIKPAQDAILDLFAKKSTAVMTNVPGPREALKFCGSTIERIMFWVPQSGNIGVGVSILSYGGGVQFGLITDAQMCPDPDEIIRRFAPEFDKLLWLALMMPRVDELEA
jgi:WS/DGAT/MGAT family acyltransferase